MTSKSDHQNNLTNMLKKNILSFNILFLLLFFVGACNYKNAKHFSPISSALSELIPSLPELEGQFDVTYTYTQNTCNNQTGEFNTIAGIKLNQTNVNWIDIFFPDAPGAISGPYDETTGNFMGETDRKPIGQGYTAQEMWNMDFYERMSNDDIITFGGISRVDVYNPDNSFNCGIDYNIYGEKISSELPPAFYALNVEIEGNGSVSSSPAGIDCGEDCSEEYEEGTEITLTASAEVGWVFDGWSGNVPDTCSDKSESCTIVMDGVKTVKATFVEEEDPFKTFIFEEVLVCIEHSSNESDILWLFEIAEFVGSELMITMVIILPDGSEVEEMLSSYSEVKALFHLDIFVTGVYEWEIISVKIDGEDYPFDGLISGTINVTGSEENAGQCSL